MILGYFLLIAFIHLTECRGPHHPRGEPIVKHVHYRPTKTDPEKITQDKELLHDREHIQEHLAEVINEPDTSKMTDAELEFYYFQLHDTDKNSKLDGLEILNAILHTVNHEDKEEYENFQPQEDEFEYFVELIDDVLQEDDLDKDGYISYPEFTSRRRDSVLSKPKGQPSVNMV